MHALEGETQESAQRTTNDVPVTLAANNVSLTYPARSKSGAGEVEALIDVDLQVRAGEFVSIVGASGCGKTSLLNMFAGLVEPTTGTVEVNGQRPQLPPRDVGYMSARDGLLSWRTAMRNVTLALEHRKDWSRSARVERARELLELVGLGSFEKAYPRQLSHGMRQRAAIARTLAADPHVLLMDEPFAALDAQTKLHLQIELLKILEARADSTAPRTVVFVTHDLHEALLLSDRVVLMLPRPGRIALVTPTNLPRPRSEHLRDIIFSDVFRDLHRELYEAMEDGSAA